MGALELQQMRSATHARARPKLCHVCVESDRQDRLRLFFVLLDNSKNQCHSLALAFSFALELEISCLILSWGLVLDIERAE